MRGTNWGNQYSGAYTEDYGDSEPRNYSRIIPPDVGLARNRPPGTVQPPVTQPEQVGRAREPSTIEALLLELVNLQRARSGIPAVNLPPISAADIPRVQVEDNQKYGFVSHQSTVIAQEFGGLADTVVLLKAATQRIYLLVQNNLTVASIVVAFGSAANTSNGILLTAGGNLEMTGFVGQDDVHIFCEAAQPGAPGDSGNVLIAYCNK